MSGVRLGLIISVAIIVPIALIFFGVILFKIFKKKKEIQKNNISIENELSTKESEIKMRQRDDYGQPISELQQIIGNTINHEIVEFCINSSIRNDFKTVLLVGNVEVYEAIAISNKANVNVIVRLKEFDIKKYNEIKNKPNIVKHSLLIVSELNENNNFDAIMCLNSTNYYDKIFLENEKYLNKKGMFIFANTKANKSSTKHLIKEVDYLGYRYDNLKWYTGFVVIVK